jgi:hypothetical protein
MALASVVFQGAASAIRPGRYPGQGPPVQVLLLNGFSTHGQHNNIEIIVRGNVHGARGRVADNVECRFVSVTTPQG